VATRRRVRRLTILILAGVLLATAAAPAGGQPGQPARARREARGVAVTLLTGDKVILRRLPGERQSVHVIPASRPGGPATFQTLSVRGDAYVLPSDVHPWSAACWTKSCSTSRRWRAWATATPRRPASP
jgi:hypothetical protein